MLRSQSVDPQSINSAGEKWQVGHIKVGFTVGELMVLQLEDSEGNRISSGFSAGTSLSVVGVVEADEQLLDISVFPNPVSELLYVAIQSTRLGRLTLLLTDVGGKVVYQGTYAGIANSIGVNFTSYAPGLYILWVQTEDKEILAHYKIIKQ